MTTVGRLTIYWVTVVVVAFITVYLITYLSRRLGAVR
jgi:hypothetical protein